MTDTRTLYLELIKKCILGLIYQDGSMHQCADGGSRDVVEGEFDAQLREGGLDWPTQAHSMIGLKRLQNSQDCIEKILTSEIPGDMVETGVWRGGSCIFMRAILKAYGVDNRKVWVCDSFEGLPKPDPDNYPIDQYADFSVYNDKLGISLEEVRENFRRYGMLDDQVEFVEGWFKDSLPGIAVEEIALLRLDGDMYESTMDALVHLYPKLSPGGFAVVDDYALLCCSKAVKDYREANGITEEIVDIDGVGAYWQKRTT